MKKDVGVIRSFSRVVLLEGHRAVKLLTPEEAEGLAAQLLSLAQDIRISKEKKNA